MAIEGLQVPVGTHLSKINNMKKSLIKSMFKYLSILIVIVFIQLLQVFVMCNKSKEWKCTSRSCAELPDFVTIGFDEGNVSRMGVVDFGKDFNGMIIFYAGRMVIILRASDSPFATYSKL